MIPKIIWQTHEWEYNELPPNFLNVVNTWKNLNPKWDHRYVSAKERTKYMSNFPEIFNFYRHTDKTTQADIWRYYVTHNYGGVYADMDSICIMPLDEMIDKNYNGEDFIATEIIDNKEAYYYGINNSNFAAVKHSKILKDTILSIVSQYNKTTIRDAFSMSNSDLLHPPFQVLKLGPAALSEVVMKNTDIVSFKFESANHSLEYKEYFELNHDVTFYGKNTRYKDLAELYNWTIY